jgi:hypothetical protein
VGALPASAPVCYDARRLPVTLGRASCPSLLDTFHRRSCLRKGLAYPCPSSPPWRSTDRPQHAA